MLRSALTRCTEHGFAVTETDAAHPEEGMPGEAGPGKAGPGGAGPATEQPQRIQLTLAVAGRGSVPELVGELMSIPGMIAVNGREAASTRD